MQRMQVEGGDVDRAAARLAVETVELVRASLAGLWPSPAPVQTVARPSFNCAYARSQGEIAICNDANLAALDRAMAAEFSRALSGAPESERALLRDTRTRFLRYRDRCADRACIADAYRGRIREIRDIAQGRWQPR